MDDLDRRLIALLRKDGRRSISDLALELGLSRATIRVAHGSAGGVTAILSAIRRSCDPMSIAMPVRGLTLIEVEGRAADRVVDALAGFTEVSAIHTTNGKWDLIVELGTQSLTELDTVLRRIRLIPGITASETNLLLATPRTAQAKRD